MFDRVSRLAEQAAGRLSRRGFLARVGMGAAAFAAFVTGADVRADKPPRYQFVLNGGCCSGSFPYLRVNKDTGDARSCCTDAKGNLCAGCITTDRCGTCGFCKGTFCRTDNTCDVPC